MARHSAREREGHVCCFSYSVAAREWVTVSKQIDVKISKPECYKSKVETRRILPY